MSTTEELIKATVNADGSATMIIEGKPTNSRQIMKPLHEHKPLNWSVPTQRKKTAPYAPWPVVEHLAEQLEIEDPSCLKEYTERPKAAYEHAWEIRDAYGYGTASIGSKGSAASPRTALRLTH